MAHGNQPPMRPPWLELGKRPERLTPLSAVFVALALVVLGGGIAAAAMRGSSPSTLLGPGAGMRPVRDGGSSGFPAAVSCASAADRWTCMPGARGGNAYRLQAVESQSDVLVLGSDSTLPPARSAAPTALVCDVHAGVLTCDASSLPAPRDTPRAIYVRTD